MPFGKYGVLAIIVAMYLIMGCFLDPVAMLLITMPFIGPVITGLGLSLIWFGVIFVIVSQVALVTPPYGMNLFVLKSVVPQHSVMTIARGCLPLIPPMLILVVLLIVFPQLAMWLPNLLFG